MELGANGVPGGSAPGHAVVAPRGGPGASLRMRTIVGSRSRVTPLKSCNVAAFLVLIQLTANSMTGWSGRIVPPLVERGSEVTPG